SPHMDGMLDAFARVAQTITFQPARIPIVSNLSGALASDQDLGSPAYWVRHVRDTVRFGQGVRSLYAQGVRTFLELGPHGVLSALSQDSLSQENEHGAFVPTLRKDRHDVDALLAALGALHVSGVSPLDWGGFFAPFAPRRVLLPTYAF